MGEQEISARGWTAASPSEVYRLLRAGATWPEWSPIDSFELEREGPEGGESLGAIRAFHTGRAASHEEIVELVADRRFSYALVSGLPLRGYRADVDIEPPRRRDGDPLAQQLPRQGPGHRWDLPPIPGWFHPALRRRARELRRRALGAIDTCVASWAWPP